ncbi:ATP-binding protein [Vibrio vulnificus]|uniref:ATP-binding protein n=1 Tax=Vibrio vulnificus TaxID=672 RepID=UPI001028F159|nr:ATP-binding protein [Vibrio vulnificus]EGR0128888.1 ATP-binding protein [Vibrio vulnificus]MCU8153969.1 ATP-binding protein [Vibrio vulnificus]RZP86192.1 ATP-binding protein [Vibrio vulnificus]RZQ28343.1 ATP-binding protein [Vibrio vulnificus]RZQ76331.1 ATP-binding protein [Vibrio vulnificus]
MITDVAGKVGNLKLKPSERLIPLFEAIVNSIQASDSKGRVEVEVIRQRTQMSLDQESDQLQEVESFKITDYGIGFNAENIQSFKTADSTFKAQLGCKGVGRFTWLKVFESVSVDSIYIENKEYYKAEFDFSIEDPDLNSLKVTPYVGDKRCITEVTLLNAKAPYQGRLPIQLEIYADAIIEHCIMYFLENKIESLIVKDNTGSKIELVDYFNKFYGNDIRTVNFTVGGNEFISYYVKSYKNQRIHKIHFCANTRAVTEYKPSDYISNIPEYFLDQERGKFRYSIYVTSPYLDENVNQERTEFSILKREDYLDEERPAIETVIGELLIQCDSVFAEFLAPMIEQHLSRVSEYVEHVGYEYRSLLKHRPDWIKLIKIGISDDDLDVELHKLLRDFEVELKSEAKSIKKTLKESKSLSSSEYKDSYKKYAEAINDVGKSNLAKYVIHRKSIVDILELSLEIRDDDKYALENAVHDIIMPLSSTNDDVTNQSQNLWLIDERMSFNTLLASDKPFSSITNIEDNRRPDILIFNNPIVFGDDDRRPNTATIIEFKRPMRDDYTAEENPIEQVMNYAKKLRNSKNLKNRKGRHINLDSTVPIYCYVVCDLTDSIREQASDRNFIPTPDNEGYIWYHGVYNVYFEIISFEKVLSDAKKRNSVLFKTLNID